MSRPRRCLVGLCCAAAWLVPLLAAADPALAQAPAAAAAPTPGQRPLPINRHVVETNDGRRLQGTVFERVPGDYWHLWLPEGRPLRLSWDQVQRAGWNAAALGRPPAPPPVRLRLLAPEEPHADVSVQLLRAYSSAEERREWTVHVREVNEYGETVEQHDEQHSESTQVTAKTGVFRPLCTAPCSFALRPGVYTFGLTLEGRLDPVGDGDPVTIDRPGTVQLVYHSRTALIIGLLAGGTVGFAGGMGIIDASVKHDNMLLGLGVGLPVLLAGSCALAAAFFIDPYVEARFVPDAPGGA